MKPTFYPSLCILFAVFFLSSLEKISAQSLLLGTLPGTSEDLLGVRYRNVRTSNSSQEDANFTGIPDLNSKKRNNKKTRVDKDLTYGNSGSYTFTITYDPALNTFTSVTYIASTTITNTFSDVSGSLTADGKTKTALDINLIELAVHTDNKKSTIGLSDLTIDGMPIAGVYERKNKKGESSWYLISSVLKNGFVISGTVTLAGDFEDDEEEKQRVQFIFGYTSANVGILPVVWGDFTAKRTTASATVLEWKTMQEQNVSHYNVQRSVDGARFETIGKVTAQGTTATVSAYRFEDKLSTGTVYYYRLQQVDFDAKTTFSSVVKQGNGGKQTLVGGAGSNNIHVQFFSNDKRQLRVITAGGNVVKQFTSTSQQQTIDMNALPSGIYALQIINSDGTAEVHRFAR